jgi:DNA-binding NtrC family response regulator
MKVLIAEDDDGIREGLVDLVSETATAVGVATLEAATQALRSERFDLVLTDLRLGGNHATTGRGVVDEAARCGTPVALVTAAARVDIQLALKGTEVAAILNKPFHLDDVVALVARFHPERQPVLNS